MKFSAAAVLVAATAVSAGYAHDNVTYVTEVVEVYTTYCPEPTTLTHGDKTYTITEATTLTITDCPCTVTKPVITSSIIECDTCTPDVPAPSAPPAPPVEEEPPVHEEPPVVPAPPTNSTLTPVVPAPSAPPADEPSEVPTAGAGKVAAAGLAGVVGLAAFLL